MDDATVTVHEILQAINAVTRYATRGCSGMACDRAREAWMGNHLAVIGRAASHATPELRNALPEVPWDRLGALADEERGVTTMTADAMQDYVQRVLPKVAKALTRDVSRSACPDRKPVL